MKTTQTKFYLTLIALFTFAFQVNAECNISTPTDQYDNPGTSFSFNVNFHPQGGNLRRASIESETGFNINTYNVHIEGVDEINGNSTTAWMPQVLGADNFHIPGGNHDMTVNGYVPSNTGCGLVATFKVKIQKRDFGIWWNECDQIFKVYTNSNGDITIVGPSSTCGLVAQNFSVQGDNANEYIWTSSNPTFTLNGSNDWPITTDNTNVVIKPTILGSSSNISVAATGFDICGVANASHTLQSINASVTLSGAPFTCNATGNPITVQASELSGAIYTWAYKNVNSTNWSPPFSTSSNTFTIPGPNVASTYNVKCGVSYNGCNSKSNVLEIKWCVNTHPQIPRACCIKQVPDEKKKSIRRSESSRNLGTPLEMDAYPNPTSGKLTLSSNTEMLSLTISNAQGKVVQEMKNNLSYVTQVNLKELPTGLYIITVRSASETNMIKIIKSD